VSAAVAIAILPALVFYVLAQRRIVAGFAGVPADGPNIELGVQVLFS
jgi:hypothetical protein